MQNDTAASYEKWLNRSTCRLGYALGWAEGSICYIVVHTGATWRIRLNHALDRSPRPPIRRGNFGEWAFIVKYRDCLPRLLSYAKTAELIEMPCGMLSRVDPSNHVLDRSRSTNGKGDFEGDGTLRRPTTPGRQLRKNG